MAINYEKYLNRLREKRSENPAYSLYKQSIQATTEPFKAITRQATGAMSRAGGSIGARSQSLLSSQMAGQGAMSDQFSTIRNQIASQNSQIDDQIADLEARQQAEKDASKDALLKTGLQAAGTVIGAAAGSIVPVVGTMAGASAGAALGNIAGSFVGGGGNMGAEYIDEAQLVQGLGDLTMGIASTVTLKDQKDLAKQLGGAILAHKDDRAWLEGLQAAYMIGTDAVREYMANPQLSNQSKIDADSQMLNDNKLIKPTQINKPTQGVVIAGTESPTSPEAAVVSPATSEQAYTIQKDGDYSIGTNGEVVTKKNGAWVKVKDAAGNKLKASLGDTIVIKADGTIEIRRK